MKKIMIIIDTSRASGRKFLAGAEKFISTWANWEVCIQPPNYLQTNDSGFESGFSSDKLDGLLARDAVNNAWITKINVPRVISDTQRELIPDASSIVTDSQKIGEIAAEYFLDLGFKNFAFCGFKEFAWSQKRYDGFKKVVMENGIETVFFFENEHAKQKQGDAERLRMSQWLKNLPRPVCVFACNDDRAISVLEVCKTSGLSVPEEVAVLGVDNDDLMCNLSSPSLSSIELNFEKAGFSAAEHLDELIQQKTENEIIVVSVVEIIKRQSTDVLAIEDKDVVSALIFIRNNFHKPIQINDVVDATCLSRRELERRFKKNLKKTIKREIERLRIEMAKSVILNSNLPVYQIASKLEFTDPEHFSRYFKNATGQTPSQFRSNS